MFPLEVDLDVACSSIGVFDCYLQETLVPWAQSETPAPLDSWELLVLKVFLEQQELWEQPVGLELQVGDSKNSLHTVSWYC